MRQKNRLWLIPLIILMSGLPAPGWGWEPSKFDSGNTGTSALGQLEDIAGQKVDRSGPGVSTIDTYKKKITLPQKAAPQAKPKVNYQASMEAMVTGMVVGSLLQAVFSDNSQQRAQEAAAQAWAAAEQKRIAEEQRQQRIQAAQRLRNAWDQRDADIAQSLDDAFSLPGQTHGANFFSAPVAKVDKSFLEDDAVNLSGVNATPALTGAGAPGVPQVNMPPLPGPEPNAFQERLVKEGADFARDMAVDAAKDSIKELALGVLPKRTAANIGMMLDYKDRFKDWTDKLITAIEPNRLVAAASGDGQAYLAVQEDLARVNRQAATLALPGNPFSNEEMEIGYKLLHNKSISFEEAQQAAMGRAKGFFSEKLKDRILDGLS